MTGWVDLGYMAIHSHCMPVDVVQSFLLRSSVRAVTMRISVQKHLWESRSPYMSHVWSTSSAMCFSMANTEYVQVVQSAVSCSTQTVANVTNWHYLYCAMLLLAHYTVLSHTLFDTVHQLSSICSRHTLQQQIFWLCTCWLSLSNLSFSLSFSSGKIPYCVHWRDKILFTARHPVALWLTTSL